MERLACEVGMEIRMETRRVRLRRFALNDLMHMRRLEGDPDVMKFTPFRVPLPFEKTLERMAALIERESADAPLGVWAAFEKADQGAGDLEADERLPAEGAAGREAGAGLVDREAPEGAFIGWFMLMMTGFEGPELGFMLVREQWGHGYATEIAARLLEYATVGLGHSSVWAVTDPANSSSEQVLKKLGFAPSGEIARRDRHLGEEMRLNAFVYRRE